MGDTGASGSKLLDMLMMVSLPGQERTEAEWRALYARAGLRLTSIMPIQSHSGESLIEGVRADRRLRARRPRHRAGLARGPRAPRPADVVTLRLPGFGNPVAGRVRPHEGRLRGLAGRADRRPRRARRSRRPRLGRDPRAPRGVPAAGPRAELGDRLRPRSTPSTSGTRSPRSGRRRRSASSSWRSSRPPRWRGAGRGRRAAGRRPRGGGARGRHDEALHPPPLPLGDHGRRGVGTRPRRLSAPGLILWGELDPYAAPTWGERLAARTARASWLLPAARTGGRWSGRPRSRCSSRQHWEAIARMIGEAASPAGRRARSSPAPAGSWTTCACRACCTRPCCARRHAHARLVSIDAKRRARRCRACARCSPPPTCPPPPSSPTGCRRRPGTDALPAAGHRPRRRPLRRRAGRPRRRRRSATSPRTRSS